jgi:hypothetical protein
MDIGDILRRFSEQKWSRTDSHDDGVNGQERCYSDINPECSPSTGIPYYIWGKFYNPASPHW